MGTGSEPVDVRSVDVAAVAHDGPSSTWFGDTSAVAPDAAGVLGALGDLVVVVGPDGRVTGCNAAATSVLGADGADLLGRAVLDMVHPADRGLAAQLYERYTAGSEVFRPAVRLLGPTGRSATTEFVARRVEGPGGTHLVLSGRVDPLVDAEELVESLRVGVVICDAAGVVTRANATAAALLGTGGVEPRGPVDAVPGRYFRDTPQGPAAVDHPLRTVLLTGRSVQARMLVEGGDGCCRVVDVEARPVTLRFAGAAAAVMTLTDVSDRAEADAELERRATTDDLTGVLNRTTFMTRVEARVEALEPGRLLALLFCDLDRFKSVNERFGHVEADDLLRRFADNVRAVAGPEGFVGRLGGDEFAVAVEVGASTEAEVLAGRLRGAARRAGLEAVHVAVTSSIGIALTAGPRDESRAVVAVGPLIEEADEALRRAKRTGRDRSQVFDAPMRAQRAEQTAMGRLLRSRLESGEVEVAVQPVVNPVTGQVAGGEVLARVRDDEGHLVAAGRWIEAAVRNGLVGAVDEAVVALAAELLGRLSRTGLDEVPVVGVNLSDATLARPDLEAWLLDLLESAGAPPTGFLVEVPETVFPVIRDRAADALRSFSDNGIWIAVDDFGTGYASLAEVRDLPINTLKVDRSFVVAGPGSPEAAILRASLEMARGLGCRSVAEGVETSEQLAMVVDLGVDYVQGYYVGRPVPVDDFVDRCLRPPEPPG